MEIIIGLDAINIAQNTVHMSGNTLFTSIRWVAKGIELLIINTYNNDLYTELITNDRINIIEGDIDELTKFELSCRTDAYKCSLSDRDILNMKYLCRLDLLGNEPILMEEDLQF